MKRTFGQISREEWFCVCSDFKKIFNENWIDYRDDLLSETLCREVVNLDLLEQLVSPKEDESQQDAILRKYGEKGVEFIMRVL